MFNLVLVAVFYIGMVSSQDQGCPDPELIAPCTCDYYSDQLRSNLICYIEDGIQLRSILNNFKDFSVDLNIYLRVLSVVTNFTLPEHIFPVGNIGHYRLTLQVYYFGNETERVALDFHPNSMTSQDGHCKLQLFSVEGFALGDFDASILRNCTDMDNFDVVSCDLKSVTNFPLLDKLEFFSVQFDGSGSVSDITPDKMPNLGVLKWIGDSRANADFFVPFFQLKNLQLVILGANALSTIPNFSNVSSALKQFSMSTDICSQNLSINFPTSNSKFDLTLSNRTQTYEIAYLSGSFQGKRITLNTNLNKLDEAVLKTPIQEGLAISLIYAIPFDCDLAWVVRQLDFNERQRITGDAKDHGHIRDLTNEDFAFCP